MLYHDDFESTETIDSTQQHSMENADKEQDGSSPKIPSALSGENATSEVPQSNPSDGTNKKTKRAICSRCFRPTPRACVCEALPPERIQLKHCTVLVLQHPHETKMKNRSLPLIELCLHPDSIEVVTGRTFLDGGNNADNHELRRLLQQPDVLLLYPDKNCDNVVNLGEALDIIDERRRKRGKQPVSDVNDTDSTSASSSDKITIILLDATWKFASEMHRANLRDEQYPEHMLFVSLTPTEQKTSQKDSPPTQPTSNKADANNEESISKSNDSLQTSSYKQHIPDEYRPRRFAHVRTPPNDNCLSTGECIAWVVSTIEQGFQDDKSAVIAKEDDTADLTKCEATPKACCESLYKTLLKPMDLMAAQWKSFTDKKGGPKVRRKVKSASRDESTSSQPIDSKSRSGSQTSNVATDGEGSGRKRKAGSITLSAGEAISPTI